MKMEAAKSADFTQDPNYQEYKSECLKMLESLVPSSQCIIVAGREITVPELIKEVEADTELGVAHVEMHKKLAERPYATGAFKDKEKSQSIFSRVFISMISAVERKLVEVKDINEYLEYAKKHKIPEVTLSAKLIETDSKLAVPKYTVLLGFKGKTRFGLEFKKSIKLESIPLLTDYSDNEYQAYCSLMEFALLKDFELSLDKENTKGIEIKLAIASSFSGLTEYTQDQHDRNMKTLSMYHFAREGFAKHFPLLARVLREEESAKSNTQ